MVSANSIETPSSTAAAASPNISGKSLLPLQIQERLANTVKAAPLSLLSSQESVSIPVSTNTPEKADIKTAPQAESKNTDSSDMEALKNSFLANATAFKKDLQSAQLALKNDLKFGFDKSSIDLNDPKSKEALEKLAKTIKSLDQLPGMRSQVFTIEGHTDSKGSKAYNQALSERRAEAVKNALIKLGVNPERLAIRGKGESEPIAQNSINGKDNPKGRALNRRAEVGFSMTDAELSTYTKKIDKWFDAEIAKSKS